jgi:sRNA-binding regulator protein Hfq
MRKFLLLSLISVVVIATTALGDTIHLKNGSVLKGKVTSFADDQFIVMLDTGSGRYLSKAMVYMGDVARIEFDSGAANPGDTSSATPQPAEAPPRMINDPPRRDTQTRVPDPGETPVRTQPADPQPRETGPPETQPVPPPVREPEPTQPEKPAVTSPPPVTTPTASETSDSERPPRKPLLPVKTMTVDVAAKKDWTSSGLIVKRGDHLRVTASGTITLDPVSGRTCGPEGISDLVDPKKLMPDQPTGALIAVISSDNDDFIFLGRSSEFTATRDGLLFLSINEGLLSDNVGAFKAVVEVLAQRKQ